MTRTPPQHGERRCYLRGCRRPECRDAHLRYCKQTDTRLHRGDRRRIDATEAAAHIRDILANDWTQSGIATVLGISIATIQGLASGENRYCTPEDRDRILAFNPSPDDECPGYWTDPTGTIRRLRALAVIGHPMRDAASELGLSYAAVRCITRGERDKVSRALAQKVAQLYATWSRKPGPSNVARGMARAKNWHGPLAWDDIDDPAAQPDIDPHADKRGRKARVDDATVIQLTEQGFSAEQIAWKLGCHERTVKRARERAQREDLGAAA